MSLQGSLLFCFPFLPPPFRLSQLWEGLVTFIRVEKMARNNKKFLFLPQFFFRHRFFFCKLFRGRVKTELKVSNPFFTAVSCILHTRCLSIYWHTLKHTPGFLQAENSLHVSSLWILCDHLVALEARPTFNYFAIFNSFSLRLQTHLQKTLFFCEGFFVRVVSKRNWIKHQLTRFIPSAEPRATGTVYVYFIAWSRWQTKHRKIIYRSLFSGHIVLRVENSQVFWEIFEQLF